jgi:hypothetical protein
MGVFQNRPGGRIQPIHPAMKSQSETAVEVHQATKRVQKNVQSCRVSEDQEASSIELHEAICHVLNRFGIKSSGRVIVAVDKLAAKCGGIHDAGY